MNSLALPRTVAEQLPPRRIPRRCTVSLAFLLVLPALTPADELDLPIGTPMNAALGPVNTDLIAPVELALAATRPVFSYQYGEMDGILAAPGESRETTVQVAAVALHWTPADRLAFRYRPAWTWFSNDAFDDHVSHDASALAEFVSSAWRATVSHRYYRASTPLIETGRQTSQDLHRTALQATRELGPKSSLELGLQQQLRSAEDFKGFREWSTQNWLHYRISTAFSGSGGFTYGYVEVEDGSDMTFQQLRGRLRWQLVRALYVDARGGWEFRQTSGAIDNSTASPVYGGTLFYSPIETTRLHLSADKRLTPSLLLNQLNHSMVWRVSLDQRLLGRLQLQLQWLYRTSDYESTADESIVLREDRGNTFRARLSTPIRTRGSIALFYQRTHNRSSQAGFGFTGRQIGVELNVRY